MLQVYLALDPVLHALLLLQSNATLTQQLADHDRLLRALRQETSDMAQQLSASHDLVISKDKIIDQLKALCSNAELAKLGLLPESSGIQDYSGSSTPSYSAVYSSSSSPGHAPGSPSRRGMSRQSSKGTGTQHAVGKVSVLLARAYCSGWHLSGISTEVRLHLICDCV